MKKINYLLGLVAIASCLASCRPLDKTYEALGPVAAPAMPVVPLTLTSTEYQYLNKGASAYKANYFKSQDTAKAQIPTILNKKFPNYTDKATVSVTYNLTPVTIKLADSALATTTRTLQTTPVSDYPFPAFNGNAANSFNDLSATAVINWLRYNYQGVPDYSLRVLTYLYFESNVTSSSGTLQTDAFLYTTANNWQKIYRINNTQYASVNRGNNFAFVSSDAANLPTYFNNFLKADAIVMASAKAGDLIYVNYKYQTSSTVSYQRVLPLTYNGTNWTTAPIPTTLQFVKTNGVWVADNTVNYKLTVTDYASIKLMPTTVNIQTALDNVGNFGDFNISTPLSPVTGWTDDQINAALIIILTHNFTAPELNQVFNITYVAYNGSTFNATKKFIYDGTQFVYQKP